MKPIVATDKGSDEHRDGDIVWLPDRESRTLDDARELAEAVIKQLGYSVPTWRKSESSVTPWEYADIDVGGRSALIVGVSSGGVVAVNGDPFTPGDRQTNVFLDRVVRSVRYGVDFLRVGIAVEAPTRTAVIDPEVLLTASYMAIGAIQVLQKLPAALHFWNQEKGGGQLELISEVSGYAPDAEALLSELDESGPGVWCYEVPEVFGSWYIEQLAAGRAPTRAEGREALIEIMADFFAQGCEDQVASGEHYRQKLSGIAYSLFAPPKVKVGMGM